MDEVKDNKNLKGVAGWLLVYLICIFIGILYSVLSLIFILVSKNSLVGAGPFSLLLTPSTGELILDILTILLSIGIVIFIVSKLRKAPKWIIIIVWSGFVLGLIKDFVYTLPRQNAAINAMYNIANMTNYGAGFIYTSALVSIGLFFAVAINITITLYFIKSKRVKNTFVK